VSNITSISDSRDHLAFFVAGTIRQLQPLNRLDLLRGWASRLATVTCSSVFWMLNHLFKSLHCRNSYNVTSTIHNSLSPRRINEKVNASCILGVPVSNSSGTPIFLKSSWFGVGPYRQRSRNLKRLRSLCKVIRPPGEQVEGKYLYTFLRKFLFPTVQIFLRFRNMTQ
jgi:hypothetical protein